MVAEKSTVPSRSEVTADSVATWEDFEMVEAYKVDYAYAVSDLTWNVTAAEIDCYEAATCHRPPSHMEDMLVHTLPGGPSTEGWQCSESLGW